MTGWEKRLEHSGAFPTSTWEAQQERDPRGGGVLQEAGVRWGVWARGQMSTCPSALE